MVDEPSAMGGAWRGCAASWPTGGLSWRPGRRIAGLAATPQAPMPRSSPSRRADPPLLYGTGKRPLARQRTFAEPAGGDWHLDLLRGATRELPGIRLAVLPRAVLDPLHEVLRFRHFFRHAYAIALDGTKLAKVARHVVTVHADVDAALGAFDRFLAELSERMDEE